jgi:hypothetical protein
MEPSLVKRVSKSSISSLMLKERREPRPSTNSWPRSKPRKKFLGANSSLMHACFTQQKTRKDKMSTSLVVTLSYILLASAGKSFSVSFLQLIMAVDYHVLSFLSLSSV